MKTIEEILATDDAHREVVPIKEWDTDVLVVSMTAKERCDLEKTWANRKVSDDPHGYRVDLLNRCLKKQDGSPFATPEQIRELLNKNCVPVERLVDEALKLSAFTKKDVKELEKN